jgi:hypothetical protein
MSLHRHSGVARPIQPDNLNACCACFREFLPDLAGFVFAGKTAGVYLERKSAVLKFDVSCAASEPLVVAEALDKFGKVA